MAWGDAFGYSTGTIRDGEENEEVSSVLKGLSGECFSSSGVVAAL